MGQNDWKIFMPQLKNDASSFIHFPYLVVCLDYLLSNLMGFYTLTQLAPSLF